MASNIDQKGKFLPTAGLRIKQLGAFLGIALVVLVFSGCGRLYGGLSGSTTVTRMFSNGNLPSDYLYYYTGRSTVPYAVIGLKPGYVQVSRMWQKMEYGSAEFKRMIRNIWEPLSEREALFQPEGAYILSAGGETIGIWYSYYPFTTVEELENGRFKIYSPYIPNRWN